MSIQATPGTSNLVVEVLSVQGVLAYVRDQLGRTFQMRRDILPAKSAPPKPKEKWIIERTFGNEWIFAAVIGAPVDPWEIEEALADVDTTLADHESRLDTLEVPPPVTKFSTGIVGVTPDTLVDATWLGGDTALYRGSTPVTFPVGLFTAAPRITLGAESAFPGTYIACSFSAATKDGCTINLARTSQTATNVHWMAFQP